MQERASFAPSLVIVACDDTIEVTVDSLLVRFTGAEPSLVMAVRHGVSFSPLLELLSHLTSPDFWPTGESELTLPAALLETAFRRVKLSEAA